MRSSSSSRPLGLISVILGVLLIVAVPNLLNSHPLGKEFIPPEHWSYDALTRFEILGFVKLPSEKPYHRDDVIGYVEEIDKNLDSSGEILGSRDRFNLDRLRSEFGDAVSKQDPKSRYDPPLLYLEEDPFYLEGDIELGLRPEKPLLDDRWWVFGLSNVSAKLHFRDWITYELRYRFTYGPERDDRSHKRKPSPRETSWYGLTSLYERSYLVFHWKRLTLFWGRDYADWGPTDDGNLLISETAESLDKLGGRLAFRRFRLTFLHSHLFFDPRRTFSAHRLEFDISALTIGVGETAVYPDRGIDPIYTLPLSSFYANQFNETKDDNLLWSFDLKYRLRRGALLYGSFLIDDFQFQRDGENPDKIGFDVGGRFALGDPVPVTVRFRYRYIDIYTYTHADSLKYHVAGAGDPLAGFPPLGAMEGPDGDLIRLDADVFPRPDVTTSVTFSMRRQGEGNDYRKFEEGLDPFPSFPSGVVEKTFFVGLGLRWELVRNSVVGLDLGWASVENRDNEPGRDEENSTLRVYALWDL
ncbi:MAG: hypothetical protein JSW58_11970 [Candidatus Latescibacterota bacterium]|nr:MAG: hypothetical protein JSW58_11970 [Candidatus Latescibacterota bacterium]